jgi:hypothetical protein
MATTITAMDMVQARRTANLAKMKPVDGAMVEKWATDAQGFTRDQIITVIQRMHREVEAGRERREANLETMAAIADRLTAIIAAK